MESKVKLSPVMVADYISKYFGAVMHVDTTRFAIAVGQGEVEEVEKAYEELCNRIISEHAYHHEEINRHFNRMRICAVTHLSGKDTKPPSLPYVFFGMS